MQLVSLNILLTNLGNLRHIHAYQPMENQICLDFKSVQKNQLRHLAQLHTSQEPSTKRSSQIQKRTNKSILITIKYGHMMSFTQNNKPHQSKLNTNSWIHMDINSSEPKHLIHQSTALNPNKRKQTRSPNSRPKKATVYMQRVILQSYRIPHKFRRRQRNFR